jgi:hypothetical protein
MPLILICVNGHQTTVPEDRPTRTLRCPECGEPVTADRPTTPELPLADETADEPVTRPAPRRKAPRPRPATPPRSGGWGRWVAVAGGLVALAGAAVGVYLLVQSRDRANAPANDREAARTTVVRFVELSRDGDQEGALGMFTDKARAEIRKGQGHPGPEMARVRPGETYEVGDAVVNGDTADVPVTVREAGQEQVVVFKVRRQGAEWRIYGFSVEVVPGEPGSRLTLDFENPQNLAKELFGIDPDAMAKDWAKETEQNLNKGFEDGFKSTPRPDDLANEALAPIDRERFEATWKVDLDVKGRPAGEVLKELAEAMGVRLVTTPAQDRALARPITLQLRGRSRRELAEEVCRRVGVYPGFEEQFGAGKLVATMVLRPGPRPHPVAFAGPFTVEVTEVAEYIPHATGRLTLQVSAANLPQPVAKLIGFGRDGKVLAITGVTDGRGRDLADAPGDPQLRSGRIVSDGYDRTVDLPLKNLLRDVTAVKAVRGTVRVSLPSQVDSLRFDSPVSGAVVKVGAIEAKLTRFHKSHMTVNNTRYPNASLQLEYKGIAPDRVRALAYDSQKKLIAVSSSGWSGTDTGGTGEFTVQGDPAVVVLKVISAIEHAEYEFALDEIPLPGAAGMPEKLVPATFPGHPAPVTLEFVRIASAQFPAKAQFRVVNHSDKDVRLIDVKLVYLDSTGRAVKDWPSVKHTPSSSADQKGPALVVRKKATAVIEVDTPFLPETARTVRATPNQVVFSDATEWMPPPVKK